MPGEIDEIARRTSPQQPIRELFAELGNEDLHHLLRALRDVVAPEVIDDAIHGDDAVGVKEQQRQQGLLLASRQLDGSGVVYRLERPQNSEVHATIIGAGRSAAPGRRGLTLNLLQCSAAPARSACCSPSRPVKGR